MVVCVVRDLKENCDMSCMINKDVHGDGSCHMMHLIIYNINNIHTQSHVYMSCDFTTCINPQTGPV